MNNNNHQQNGRYAKLNNVNDDVNPSLEEVNNNMDSYEYWSDNNDSSPRQDTFKISTGQNNLNQQAGFDNTSSAFSEKSRYNYGGSASERLGRRKQAKNEGDKLRIANIVLSGVLLVSIIAMFGICISMNIFPFLWLLVGGIICSAILAALLIFSIRRKTKPRTRIVLCVINSILIIFSGIIGFYLWTTLSFVDNIDDGSYKKEVYDVVVLKDSKYNEIEDLKNKTVGTTNNKNSAYQEALQKMKELVTIEESEDYQDFFELENALVGQEIESMLLPDTRYGILKESDKDNYSKTRILYQIDVWVPVDSSVDDVDITTTPFNILVSGVDTYGDISSTARSDVNMVVTVNPVSHKILLTSIPRDYYVQLHDTVGSKDKLTHAGVYGVDMSVATIEDLLGIKINYYVRCNFTGLVGLVDAIDGIDIDSDKQFTAKADKSCKFIQGIQHVDGKHALAYARERKTYGSGDRHRVQNQQQVLDAIIEKITSSAVLLTSYSNILGSLGESFQTNINQNRIYSIIRHQLNDMPKWKIEKYSLDGTGSSQPTYSMGAQLLYVMIPDQNTIDEAKSKIANTMKVD